MYMAFFKEEMADRSASGIVTPPSAAPLVLRFLTAGARVTVEAPFGCSGDCSSASALRFIVGVLACAPLVFFAGVPFAAAAAAAGVVFVEGGLVVELSSS